LLVITPPNQLTAPVTSKLIPITLRNSFYITADFLESLKAAGNHLSTGTLNKLLFSKELNMCAAAGLGFSTQYTGSHPLKNVNNRKAIS
jgi:hypothetical protein